MLFNQYSGGIKLPYEIMIPDSIYLMHLAETGLIGFTGLILFLINIFKKAVSFYKRMEGDNKDMSFALILGFTGLLINLASFDGFLWRTPFYLFWMLAGAIAGLS
jgi:O-antigen ligase